MAAAATDKFTKASSGTRPVPTTLTATLASGASPGTATCAALTGWATDTAVHFVIYTTDVNGNKVAGSQTDWKGIVSGSTITNLALKAGTNSGYSTGAIVEAAPTAAWADDMAGGMVVGHNQDGTHKAFTESNLIPAAAIQSDAVTTAKILDSNVTTAKIADDAVTAAKMQYGLIRQRQGGSTGDASWFAPGTTTVDTSAKAAFIQVGSAPATNTATITFPTAFSQIPLVFVSVTSAANQNCWARVSAITATTFTYQVFQNTSTLGTGENIAWMAVGQ